MDLWIVMQWVKGVWDEREQKFTDCIYEFAGVFDSQEKAEAACRDHTYNVAPIKLNQTFPHETVSIPGEYYPKQKPQD